MARYRDKPLVEAIGRHLHRDEQLFDYAYGGKQPHIGRTQPCASRHPRRAARSGAADKGGVLAMNHRRFFVRRIEGANADVQEVQECDRAQMPPVETQIGGIFAHLRIRDEAMTFIAESPSMGTKRNRRHSLAIEAALTRAAA